MILLRKLEQIAEEKGYFSHMQFGFSEGVGCLEASYVINSYFSSKQTMSCKKPWGLLLSPSKKSRNLDFMTAFTTSDIFGTVIILPRNLTFSG